MMCFTMIDDPVDARLRRNRPAVHPTQQSMMHDKARIHVHEAQQVVVTLSTLDVLTALAVPEFAELALGESEVMSYLVKHRLADLGHHPASRSAGALDVALIDHDSFGIAVRGVDLALGQRRAAVKPQQRPRIAQAQLLARRFLGHVLDVNHDLLKIAVEPGRDGLDRLLDDRFELFVAQAHPNHVTSFNAQVWRDRLAAFTIPHRCRVALAACLQEYIP